MEKTKSDTNNLDLYGKLKNVPKEALTSIKEGRIKGMSSINTMWRIKRMTEVFGPFGIGWGYEVVRQWTEQCSDGQVAAFVNISLWYIDPQTGRRSEPVPGNGGNILLRRESKGMYMNDEAFKMATSDAISSACKMIGLAADVYFEQDPDNKYRHEGTVQSAVQEQTPVQTQRKPQQAAYANDRKPEMNKLSSKWNYSVAVIAASQDSNDELRRKLEMKYTVTDENFNELLRLAGRRAN